MTLRDLERLKEWFSMYSAEKHLHRNPAIKIFYCPPQVSIHISRSILPAMPRMAADPVHPDTTPVRWEPMGCRNRTWYWPMTLRHGRGVVQPACIFRQLEKKKGKAKSRRCERWTEKSLKAMVIQKIRLLQSAHIRNLSYHLVVSSPKALTSHLLPDL